MFDWVLNTPLFLDGHYLYGFSSLYVHIVVPEYSSRLQFYRVYYVSNSVFFVFDPKCFYEMATRCIIVIYLCIHENGPRETA